MPQQTGGPGGRKSKVENQEAANDLEAATTAATPPATPETQVITPESGERITIEHAPGSAGEQAPSRQLTDQDPPLGVEFDDEEMRDVIPSYGNEEEEFLYGPTDYPDTPANFGVTSQTPPAPKQMMQYLGTLADAAADPGAPDEVHMLLRVLTEMIEE